MLNRILEKILSNSKEEKRLIGVRKNSDEDNCWIGYIVDYNDELIVLQHISPLGMEDGLVVEELKNIDSLETDDSYVKSIQLLYENSKRLANQNVRNIDLNSEDNWQFELLQNTFDQGKIISVEINNADNVDYGFVYDFDELTLQLKAIGKTGEEVGLQTYHLADITSLTIDRLEARKRETLYILNKTKK